MNLKTAIEAIEAIEGAPVTHIQYEDGSKNKFVYAINFSGLKFIDLTPSSLKPPVAITTVLDVIERWSPIANGEYSTHAVAYARQRIKEAVKSLSK